ncbi:MAG: hypothetical protein M0038_13490 [Pseudomonadota bacterium]|nr:hypothetical protein [Pseudomonadota bacterium]
MTCGPAHTKPHAPAVPHRGIGLLAKPAATKWCWASGLGQYATQVTRHRHTRKVLRTGAVLA